LTATGRISKWLNWGLTRIDRFCDLKGLGKHVKCACVVDQTEYAFPTDLKYVRTFRLLDHILTTYTAEDDVDATTDLITVDMKITTGTRIIFLDTPPDAKYVMDIRYVKWQEELGEDGKPEVLKIDDLIVAATVVEAW
ncbi:unnamed protein product, partial [marine sediment metagenome]